MCVSHSVRLFCDPMDCVACQVPLSMEFSRQEYWTGNKKKKEYWTGWLFPSPGDLPDSGTKPEHLLRLFHRQVDSLPLNHLGRPYMSLHVIFSSHHFFSLYSPAHEKKSRRYISSSWFCFFTFLFNLASATTGSRSADLSWEGFSWGRTAEAAAGSIGNLMRQSVLEHSPAFCRLTG